MCCCAEWARPSAERSDGKKKGEELGVLVARFLGWLCGGLRRSVSGCAEAARCAALCTAGTVLQRGGTAAVCLLDVRAPIGHEVSERSSDSVFGN